MDDFCEECGCFCEADECICTLTECLFCQELGCSQPWLEY